MSAPSRGHRAWWAGCVTLVFVATVVLGDPPPVALSIASAKPNPALSEVSLPASEGGNATLVLDNQGVGIGTVEALQVFPQTGTLEIVGLDDLGRVQVCAGYSGKWTPTTSQAGGPRDTVEPFDALAAGGLPGGWTAAITGEGVPCWRVEQDAAAFSAPHVLRQSGIAPKPSFPLCLVEHSALQDGFVETQFKTVSGAIDQAAGVVWCARDAANYYVCRANALENNVVLYKVQDGKRQALDIVGRMGGYGVETRVAPGVWHTLRVEFVGARFRVVLDGNQLFEVEDASFGDAGRVGLWTKADSVTSFDDFTYAGR